MKISPYLRNAAIVGIEPKRVGLTVALAAHAAVLVGLLFGLHGSPRELVPIPVMLITQSEHFDSSLLAPHLGVASRFTRIESKAGASAHQSSSKPSSVLARSTRGPVVATGQLNESLMGAALASDPNSLPSNWEMRHLISSTAPATGGGKAALAKQQSADPTVTRRTDWQDNPVDDKEVKYSAPGGTVQLTVREASSAGLLATNFVPHNNLNTANASQQLSLASTEWPTNTMARSHKVDWTVVNLSNFGVTVFGYQNEVGSGFKPFGETRKEFATPGTKTIKAGGQVRVGALIFGFAHSRIANTIDSNVNLFTAPESNANFLAAQDSNAKFFAAQNEASVTLALPQLLPGVQESISNLLPNLWASVSDRQPLHTGSETVIAASNTVSTSFGATWNWNNGNATLSYWSYSSGNSPGLGATWGGRGFDANLGMYRSAFGIYVGVSYGQSEDTAWSWQSARTLYNSYVTVSYKPDKLPAISVTAAAGNYNYNAIAYSVMPSDVYANLNPYADSSHDTYSSLTVGLDFTNWLLSNQTLRTPSIKLLYRYSENAFFDQYVQTVKNTNSLVAMMIQGKF